MDIIDNKVVMCNFANMYSMYLNLLVINKPIDYEKSFNHFSNCIDGNVFN